MQNNLIMGVGVSKEGVGIGGAEAGTAFKPEVKAVESFDVKTMTWVSGSITGLKAGSVEEAQRQFSQSLIKQKG